MKPVVTVEEMKAIDADAPVPVEVLVERAGAAVARAAMRMLGGTYGRRVVVVAGKGNNGADGRAAATRLGRRGLRVTVLEAADAPKSVPPCHLVIDAAYGTGFRGSYRAPDPGSAPVLAIDVPSGVHGQTGEACEGAVRAARTVTFAALKPGLLLGAGPERAGTVEVADIGLEIGQPAIHLVEDGDVAALLPRRQRQSHKWQSAVYVVAGSGGMLGAAMLAAKGALRAGGGYARLGTPGAGGRDFPPSEVVGRSLPAEGWAERVLEDAGRFKALVIGPGVGTEEATRESVRRLVAEAPLPVVIDGDGLTCLAGADLGGLLAARPAATVLTPHDGEFARLAGDRPAPDRIEATRRLARSGSAVVLLKGPTTVIAAPGGKTLLVASGGPRLATAGSGDVLSGVIGAFLAAGLGPLEAAGLAAHAHGAAAELGPAVGLVAGDLLELLPRWLSRVAGSG